MAAIVGLGIVWRRDVTSWPSRENSFISIGVSASISPMSAPATKAFSPAPVRMTAWTLSVWASPRRRARPPPADPPPRHEGLLARPGEDDRMDALGLGEPPEDRPQLLEHGTVQGVEHARAGERADTE